MNDAKQGLFEMVIVKDISRFARNTDGFFAEHPRAEGPGH